MFVWVYAPFGDVQESADFALAMDKQSRHDNDEDYEYKDEGKDGCVDENEIGNKDDSNDQRV